MSHETDGPTGHFDRWETLEALLEHHSPHEPETPDLQTYRAWTSKQRKKFDDERVARIAGAIVVVTPAMEELELECRRAALFAQRDIGRTGVILSGPATMGKTTTAFRAMADGLKRHERRHPDWKAMGHHPVVYVEVPPGSNGRTIMGRFLHFFGVPVLDRMTLEQRTQLVTELLKASATSLVVIDEMQNLSGVTNTGRFESAQALKNLMNAVKAVPLFVGIDLDNSALTNNELGAQIAARCSLVRLGRLEIASAEGRRLWAGVIVAFERQLGLINHPPRTLLPHAEHLWNRTRGSIAALSRLLTTAALDLIDQGDPEAELMTKEFLDTVKLDLTTERELDRTRGPVRPRKGVRHAA